MLFKNASILEVIKIKLLKYGIFHFLINTIGPEMNMVA
jgi:hypothetical protein